MSAVITFNDRLYTRTPLTTPFSTYVPIEVILTRLKMQLKREDIILEMNKHFYEGFLSWYSLNIRKKEKICELAKQDQD